MEPKRVSISSSVNRLVSGTTNQTNRTPPNVIRPKKMKVPYDRCFNMSGVIWPTMKLLIQLEDAPRAMPYALLLNGQTSEMMTQAQGPQPTRLERG